MCGIVAMYSPRGPIRPTPWSGRLADSPTAGRTDSGRGSPTIGGSGWAMPGSASSTWPPASSRSPARTRRLRIVVNGEFYDFERVQRDLEGRGHRLRTRSDSEIALHLYEDLGTACLRQLRGEFAFALWDGLNDTLFAARDRFGIKPLYYAQHGGTLYLASEIKALLAAGVPARWDRAAFFQANHFLRGPQDRTLFDGIYQVPPGHYLLATGGQVRLIRYWDFDYPPADGDPADRPRRRVRRAVPARPGRGGTPAPPGRRAGRLLSQRRDRLLRRAGPGGGAPREPIRAFTPEPSTGAARRGVRRGARRVLLGRRIRTGWSCSRRTARRGWGGC